MSSLPLRKGGASTRFKESIEVPYRAIFEQGPDVVLCVEPVTGNILRCNEAIRTELGYEPNEVVGRPVRSLAPPEEFDGAWSTMTGCGELLDTDIDVLLNGGGKAQMSASATAIRGHDGELLCGLTLWRDISLRRRFEWSLQAHRTQLRALAYEITVAEVRERERIARGLHDGVSQILATIGVKLGELDQAPPTLRRRALIEELRRLTRQAARATRTATYQLYSPQLHQQGLQAAIEDLGQDIECEHGLCVHVEGDHPLLALSKPVLDVVFRGVRELLFNVQKHAQADNAWVEVRRDGDSLVIHVEDDGVGFDADSESWEPSSESRSGLLSIDSQLQAVGGCLYVDSIRGTGTRAVVKLPLPVASAN